MKKRTLPLVALAFLSALTAEFLLGDQYLSSAGAGAQVGMLLFFVVFYGSGAILIRETARRLQLGWPGIMLLAFAFGVFEEGLLTQSLFNPDYVGQHLLAPAYIPALGIGAEWTVFVIPLHVIWSMGSPIALFEANFGEAPRLRRVGLSVCSMIFALGSIGIFAVSLGMSDEHFMASPLQLASAAAIALVTAVIAVRLPRRLPAAHRSGGLFVGLAVTSAFQLASKLDDQISPWLGTLALVAVLVIGGMLAGKFRPVSLAAGAILTYCWVGFANAADHGAPAMIEQGVIIAAYLVLLVVTLRRESMPTIGHALHTRSDRRNRSRNDHAGVSTLGTGSGQTGLTYPKLTWSGGDRLHRQGEEDLRGRRA
ncbi:hypothetical protein [Antrihabitans cavernicola]|uniref:hypothetical protein n=1 Tax=Antrihabitans cavernicola TaxID=2495913 RepID=UPI0033902A67